MGKMITKDNRIIVLVVFALIILLLQFDSVIAEEQAFSSVEEASVYVRNSMIMRDQSIRFEYRGGIYDGILAEIMNMAMSHTGNPVEGDYIRWHHCSYSGNVEDSGSGGHFITYTVSYATTKELENEVTEKLSVIMDSLDLQGKTDYQKIRDIYYWICRNVTYDKNNVGNTDSSLQYSAYATLIEHRAVCQGFANLFYRMVLEAGLDARLIKGDVDNNGNLLGHGWNIVKLDGKYYFLDATWDSENAPYNFKYYLKGSESFLSDHFISSDYEQEYSQYDISITDYAYDDSDYTVIGLCDNDLAWSHSVGTKTLTVEGNGSMADFSVLQGDIRLASWKNIDIYDIVIEPRVVSIGENAFFDLPHLQSVILPDTLVNIGKQAFYRCDNLKEISIPPSVQTIGNLALGYYFSNGSNVKVDNLLSTARTSLQVRHMLKDMDLIVIDSLMN